METQILTKWINRNRTIFSDLVRVYLGAALFLKGMYFLFHKQHLFEIVDNIELTPHFLLVHYIIVAHIIGGLFLASGLLTRAAALLQVPILAGAIFFVHFEQGFFSQAQTLEFTLLTVFLLILLSIFGSGKLSLDHVVSRRTQKLRHEPGKQV